MVSAGITSDSRGGLNLFRVALVKAMQQQEHSLLSYILVVLTTTLTFECDS